MNKKWKHKLSLEEASFHYFEWLCDLVGVVRDEDIVGNTDNFEPNYWYLLHRLWETPFTWTQPNDDNRIADGLALRDMYFDYDDTIIEKPRGPCSVLEMMIALAIRMDDMLMMPGEISQLKDRFFELIHNLGLLRFEDKLYLENVHNPNIDNGRSFRRYTRDMREVDRILNVLINREYDKNGHGGLFPLYKTNEDQRHVEIWYQMNEYLLENYYDEEYV